MLVIPTVRVRRSASAVEEEEAEEAAALLGWDTLLSRGRRRRTSGMKTY